MGYSRKEEIAKLRRERREAKASQRRKENTRDRLVRFLVVCEGTKTEPQYFEALINNCISTVREVEIKGEGRATVALVKQALEIKNDLEYKNAMSFDRVWVVFDKDDFNDFNEAIKEAHRLGFQSAWTNEAFELWYYLHFEYLDTGIGRKAYIDKIEAFLRKKMGDKHFKYTKGNPEIYRLLQKYGDEALAKRHAQKLRKTYTGKDYATHKPCTMVDKLVEELEEPEKLWKNE
ncbi:MAG: RloB family protein [Bacteroides sp.]|nr:RloB family protein [Bacteroides sp.]MCM1085958.1 RloB family protein [Bacteroides sp.]